MSEQATMTVIRAGAQPPCTGKTSFICRGCASWPVMKKAAQPGGPWHGSIINCSITGLAVKWEK